MDAAPVLISQSYYSKLIVAHAVFGSLAAMILAPAAILSARWLRNTRWFPAHALLNLATAMSIVITFALGTQAAMSGGHGSQFVGEHASRHHKLGLAVFILVILQSVGGAAIHWLPQGHFIRWSHVGIGLVVAGCLYAQTYLGFGEWNENTDTGTTVPRGVVIVFWILFALEVAAYVAGIAFGRRFSQLPVSKPAKPASSSDEKLTMRESA